VRAGLLRHRVTISTPSTAQDAFGQAIETYPVGTTVWGEVTEQQMAEDQEQDGTVRRRKLSIVIRQPLTLTTRSRISYGGSDFNVTDIIDPYGDSSLWKIIAESIA
jgi:SPP1 family predicted phage head-tail adaptor